MKDAHIYQKNYTGIIVKYDEYAIRLIQETDSIPIEPAAIPSLIKALLDGMSINEPDKGTMKQ